MNILIADDEAAIGKRLVQLLRGLPETGIVDYRTDIPHTVAALRDFQPDVLILDHHFPEGSGFDVLQELMHASPRTKVIIFSLNISRAERAQYRCAGVDTFFNKATDVDALLNFVQRAECWMPPRTEANRIEREEG